MLFSSRAARRVLLGLVAAVPLIAAQPALATSSVLGSVAPPSASPFSYGSAYVAQTSAEAGTPGFTVPINGILTSFSMREPGFIPTQRPRLMVVRPDGATKFTVVALSDPV